MDGSKLRTDGVSLRSQFLALRLVSIFQLPLLAPKTKIGSAVIHCGSSVASNFGCDLENCKDRRIITKKQTSVVLRSTSLNLSGSPVLLSGLGVASSYFREEPIGSDILGVSPEVSVQELSRNFETPLLNGIWA